jgi:hypothetical protein
MRVLLPNPYCRLLNMLIIIEEGSSSSSAMIMPMTEDRRILECIHAINVLPKISLQHNNLL